MISENRYAVLQDEGQSGPNNSFEDGSQQPEHLYLQLVTPPSSDADGSESEEAGDPILHPVTAPLSNTAADGSENEPGVHSPDSAPPSNKPAEEEQELNEDERYLFEQKSDSRSISRQKKLGTKKNYKRKRVEPSNAKMSNPSGPEEEINLEDSTEALVEGHHKAKRRQLGMRLKSQYFRWDRKTPFRVQEKTKKRLN